MNRTTETKLHASLTEAITKWWEDRAEGEWLPYVGDNTPEIMARAALTVLVGVADLYETLERNNELSEEK